MENYIPLFVIVAVFGGLGAIAYTSINNYFRKRKISRKILAGALIVDVRDEDEFKSGHFQKAVNIPYKNLGQHLHLLGSHNTSIILYCHSGVRSKKALHQLKRLGYKDVLYARSSQDLPMYTTEVQ